MWLILFEYLKITFTITLCLDLRPRVTPYVPVLSHPHVIFRLLYNHPFVFNVFLQSAWIT